MVKTTISIEQQTVGRLKKEWQHADDTYDSVINRILNAVSPQKEAGGTVSRPEVGEGEPKQGGAP